MIKRKKGSLQKSLIYTLFGVALVAGVTLKQTSSEAAPKGSSTAGTKTGVFAVVYERGSAYQKGKPISEQHRVKEHIAYTEALGNKLIAGGLLRSARPDQVVGMIIFEAASTQAAEQWLRKDPAVVGKVLRASVRQWEVSNIRAYRQE